MKTTARVLTGWIAVALGCSAGNALAGLPQSAVVAWIGTASAGQQTDGSEGGTGQRRQKSDELLGRAREAMAQNDLTTADSLISQAEALAIEYPAFYMGDTAKKARRDLEKMRSATGGSPSALPGNIFSPFAKKTPPPTDPFAARSNTAPANPAGLAAGAGFNAGGASPDASSVTRLPPTGLPTMGRPDSAAALLGSPMPFGQSTPMAPPSGDDLHLPPALARGVMSASPDAGPVAQTNGVTGDRTQSDELLHRARLALAVGDVRRASAMVAQAKQSPVRYSQSDDSPERVEAAIAKCQELNGMEKNTDLYRRAYARLLMEQAEALMRWGEFDQADQLAAQAARQQVVYGPYEAKPEDLLKRIATVRQKGGPASASPGRPAETAALDPTQAAKRRAGDLIRQARQAAAAGQLGQAEFLALQAQQLRVPDAAYAPGEDRPSFILSDLQQAKMRTASAVVPVGGTSGLAAGGMPGADPYAQRAVYDPTRDPTRNTQVSNQAPPEPAEPIATPPARPGSANEQTTSPGYSLFQQGEAALKAHDRDQAYQLFRQAAAYMNELDPMTAQRLQDHLQLLSIPRSQAGHPMQPGQPGSPADEAAARQQALLRQVATELAHQETQAKAMREKDPKGSLALLEQERRKVESAGLDPASRDQLLKRVDRALADTHHYIDDNRPKIELAEKNDKVRSEIARDQTVRQQTQDKVKELVDQFNQLIAEQRYPEAVVVAKRALELAPREPVVQQMQLTAKIAMNVDLNKRNKEAIEDGFMHSLGEVDRAAAAPLTDDPMSFPDTKNWSDLTKKRKLAAMDHNRRRTERELDIEKKLKTPVSFTFRNKPLGAALDELAKLAGINIHLDDEGLRQEGISPDMPVTLEISQEIMLKSALDLMLESHHLSAIIRHEVLTVTSEQMKSGQIETRTYPVGDLVMPIPNFVASPRMGLAGAYHDALGNINGGNGPFGTVATPLAVVASRDGKQNSATINPAVLAQMPGGHAPGMGPGGATQSMSGAAGPGGAGGGAQADFESLIDLITQTVAPKSWEQNGGQGNIAPFETNLSLVVSQTQEVHEQIADLLEQLRRMQDLQVTIEVRFITLQDNFFERIGVDFDFNVQNSSNPGSAGFAVTQNTAGQNVVTRVANTGTAVVGLQNSGSNPAQSAVLNPSNGVFTNDLDIPFTQGSYALAVPQFGGFDAAAGASLGFAVLSNIEAFFFVNAAQGDIRTNVLQAPKVTLFNGQQAFVSDTSQTPFVISVIPVVGDFAAAQQPVIVVLSEGTFMTVQAVVSNDRRFVRLTIVPFFSKIGNVNTFTFQGSTTTTTDTTRNGVIDQAKGLFNNNRDQNTTTSSGITVQLPTFSFVTVTTTVSVPDGGTVLLGGIKRLSEGRNEFGVPILDKIPYLDRLFKNVGIGRETSSLMMMVTPRIIIQEEEEEKMGIAPPP